MRLQAAGKKEKLSLCPPASRLRPPADLTGPWWNGRHASLRCWCPSWCEGSTPSGPTTRGCRPKAAGCREVLTSSLPSPVSSLPCRGDGMADISHSECGAPPCAWGFESPSRHHASARASLPRPSTVAPCGAQRSARPGRSHLPPLGSVAATACLRRTRVAAGSS